MNTDKHVLSLTGGHKRTFSFHECVGRGGFGEVYRADMVLPSGVRQTVAVKVLRKGVDPSGQSVQRLRDEAHLLAALDHPALLRVYDLVIVAGRVGLVTEFVDGEDLHALLKIGSGVSQAMLCEVLADIASGLHAAWSTPGRDGKPLQLVHRDIKPANLRVSKHGQAKLLDFGIARANIARRATTTTDTIVGTYQYMSPERFNQETGPASDVFALGCVLLEGFRGDRLFHTITLQKHFITMASPENYRPAVAAELATLPPSTPAAIRTLITEMLAFETADRPTAFEVAARLEAAASSLPGLSARAWCRQHVFPDTSIEGDLSGRTLVDGAPAEDEPSSRNVEVAPVSRFDNPPSVETVEGAALFDTRRRRRRGTPVWIWVLLLGTLGGITFLSLFTFTGLVVAQSVLEEPETPATPEVAPPGPEIVAEPDPVAPAVPDPVEVEPDPQPVPEVEPDPEETPSPLPVVPAQVTFAGSVPIRLRGSGASVTRTGAVSPGTYRVEADFGKGWTVVRELNVTSAQRLTVRCRRLMQTCDVQ